tara:strand:+ start:404 stop:754 length:351 start_codon:yes stop_codon:yes gene_type:complete
MSSAMESISERVQQSRERRRRAGLKRVEVFVPKGKEDQLKAYAADLREGSQSELMNEARKLIARAYKKYRSRYLDNISVDPQSASLSDAAVVAAALMHRGDAEAYKLGQQLNRLAR